MPAVLPRFLIWIDSVGGFLVCPGDEVTFGQAVPGNPVDVPLVADFRGISSRFAATPRDTWPSRCARRRSTASGSAAGRALSDGDRLTLARSSCSFAGRIRFRPRPGSTWPMRHRTRPACDAVLLMADSCVLGPKPNSHSCAATGRRDVVLFRQPAGLVCHTRRPFEIDGREF